MADIITIGGTKIYKFNSQDKKSMKHSFNYAIKQGNTIQGFKSLTPINRILGTKITLKNFKRK